MRTRNPDNRFRALYRATEEPEHPLEAALWKLRRGETVDGVVSYAHELYSSILQREILQAWLLARASDDTINHWLRIPTEVTRAYRHLFFDVNIFRDELDILSWVQEYEQERMGTEHGAQLLQIAVMEGVDKLAFLYGRGDADIDPEKVQRVVMTEAYHRGRAHRGAPVSSRDAAAAHSFMNTAVKIAQGLGKKGGPDIDGLRLKLAFKDQTQPINEAVEGGEIVLH